MDQTPDKKLRQGFPGPCYSRREWEQAAGALAHLFPERASWLLTEDEGVGGSRGRAGEMS